MSDKKSLRKSKIEKHSKRSKHYKHSKYNSDRNEKNKKNHKNKDNKRNPSLFFKILKYFLLFVMVLFFWVKNKDLFYGFSSSQKIGIIFFSYLLMCILFNRDKNHKNQSYKNQKDKKDKKDNNESYKSLFIFFFVGCFIIFGLSRS